MSLRLLFAVVLLVSLKANASLQCLELFSLSDTKSISQNDVQKMLDQSRDGSRQTHLSKDQLDFFMSLLHQTPQALDLLSPKASLEQLSVFAQWRLLPPRAWSDSAWQRLAVKIDSWASKEFLAFALQRKVSPLDIPNDFLQAYLASLRQKFTSLDLNTQLETFSAELYHGNPWTSKDFEFYVSHLTERLREKTGKVQIKPLKEVHRGLLFTSDSQQSPLILGLREQLENHLQKYNLSLDDGGASGVRFSSSTTDSRFVTLAMDLLQLFPGSQFKYEYKDTLTPGFFDSVDLLVVEPRLVVEWDGPHHYFRSISAEGDVFVSYDLSKLRPLDTQRDRVLRAQGYRILRISPLHAKQLDALNIEGLIQRQNP